MLVFVLLFVLLELVVVVVVVLVVVFCCSLVHVAVVLRVGIGVFRLLYVASFRFIRLKIVFMLFDVSRMCFFLVVPQTNAEQEKEAGLVSVDEELRDNSVPMCLSGFDEKGLFGADGKESGPCPGYGKE